MIELILVVLLGQVGPPPAVCDVQPWLVVCDGHGDPAPGPGAEGQPRMDWDAAEALSSVCDTAPPRPRFLQRLVWQTGPLGGEWVHVSHFPGRASGDPVPGGPPDAVFAADGFVYRFECVSASFGADVWAEARRRMDPVFAEHDPFVRGLTGLETRVWYSGDAVVEPFRMVWSDPGSGITWTVEAWAWIRDFRWDFGDGTARSRAATSVDRVGAAQGSSAAPAATHVYQATSRSTGFEDGFPFVFSATWTGEYMWSSDSGATWSAAVPMANTFTDLASTSFEVVEIRSAIAG